MAGYRKILHTFMVLLILAKTSYTTEVTEGTTKENAEKDKNDEIEASESKDGQFEIVKRIKKVNRDGSYTIGYEADDGSFKIESRDVLGRVRGTYGYVDENGRVRRVTYDRGNDAVNAANLTESEEEEENATASSTAATGTSTAAVEHHIPTKLKRNETSRLTVSGTTSTSRRPTFIFSSTVTTPTSTANSVVQSIPRKRTSSTITSTTPATPNYEQVVTYSSATPRVLLQGGHQLARPPQNDQSSIVTVKPIALPLSLSTVSPDEGGESKILRRQSGQHHSNSFDAREHVHRLRQSFGHDSSDVYSAGSMTTGISKPPLFTTTHRPAIRSLVTEQLTQMDQPVITTLRPVKLATVSHPSPTHSNVPYAVHNDATPAQSTTTPIPATSIRDQLVAVRQPDGRHAVLIPLSHLQAGYVPILRVPPLNERQYKEEPTRHPTVVEFNRHQQDILRRLPAALPPPLPVRVDQNGYIGEATRQTPPQYITPTFTSTSRYEPGQINDDIDNIRPPVSTTDLQRLLEQLILRQNRLEKIVALTRRAPRLPEEYDQYQQTQPRHLQHHGLAQYRRPYPAQLVINQEPVADASHQSEYAPDTESLRPTRRFARQRQIHPQENNQQQYLPSDVREMLLLRMLQLAINPALPVAEEDIQEIEEEERRGGGVRNVEILGEEDQEDERQQRRLRQKRLLESSEMNFPFEEKLPKY